MGETVVPRRHPKNRPETLEKRDAILKAATEVFGLKGYANASLAEIAQRVGMTHAGVLHHFGSKQNLLLETVSYREVLDHAEKGPATIPSGRALFDHLVETACRNSERADIVRAFVVLSTEAVTDSHPTVAYFRERYQGLRGEISASFRTLCADAGVTDVDAIDHASASIIGVMDGLQYQWLLDPESIELGPATRFAINSIVAAVLETRDGGPGAP